MNYLLFLLKFLLISFIKSHAKIERNTQHSQQHLKLTENINIVPIMEQFCKIYVHKKFTHEISKDIYVREYLVEQKRFYFTLLKESSK